MTPRLHKTLKVSAETHHAIKLLAAQNDVSMAWMVENMTLLHKFMQKLADSHHLSIPHLLDEFRATAQE